MTRTQKLRVWLFGEKQKDNEAIGQETAGDCPARDDLWLTVHARVPTWRVRELINEAAARSISLSVLLGGMLMPQAAAPAKPAARPRKGRKVA